MLVVNDNFVKLGEKIFEKENEKKIREIEGVSVQKNPNWKLNIFLAINWLSFLFNFSLVKIIKKLKPELPEWKIKWGLGRSRWHRSNPFFDWFGGLSREVKIKAATQEALDIFYNAPEIIPNLKWWKPQDVLAKIWLGLNNSRAVRNRCIILTHKIAEEIISLQKEQGEVRGVSLACGSAKSVVDGILLAKAISPIPIKVKFLLIDKSEEALKSAKKRIEKAGLNDNFILKKGTTRNLEEFVLNFLSWVNFGEMAGFGDYLSDEKLVRVLVKFKRCLRNDGRFITCNICPNPEKPFMDWTVLWAMIYRTKEDFRKILKKADFDKGTIFHEPLKVHVIAVMHA